MPSLKIDLIVDDKGNITIAKAEKGLEALNAEATKLGASFSGALGKMQTTLEGMNVSLRKTEAHTAQTSKSIAGLTRSILRLYAAYYVITSGIQAVSGAMLKGIEIIDQYSNAITTMAALVTSKMKFNPGETLAEGYARARTYADGLVKTLESIDKHSSMSQRELIAMAETMTRAGVTLNYTNAEAVKGFTELSNALSAVIGNVPDRMRQINQEIKALLTGQVRPSDALAQTVASMTPQFEKQLAIHKKVGDHWQWLAGLVKGFAAAQSDIDRQWQATKSTLQTIATQILREGFGKAYKEIIEQTKKLSKWALDHKKEIADIINSGWNVLKTTVSGIAAPFQAAAWAVSNLRKEIVTLSATLTGIYLSGVIATALETGKLIKLFRELIQVIEILSSRALLTLASRFGLVGIAVGAAAYGVMTMIERQKELDKIVQGNDLDAINKKIDEYTKKLKSIPTSADLYAQAQNRGKNPYQEELDRLIAARDRLLAEQKRTADEMEKARKAANVQLNQNPNDEATKKAADEAERLAEQFQKAVNSITDNIARLQAETSGISEFRVELEKNRIEYEKYIRDIDEKFTPAQRAQLTAWAEQELRLKDQAAAIKETDRQRKLAVDGIKTETDATLKQLQANQDIATSFVHLSDTLDPITGSYKQYDKQIKEVAAAQKLLNDAMSGDVKAKQVVNEQQITQDQINRTKALVEAQRELYNATNVAAFYDQISGMEDEALAKKLAAIEAERQAKLILYTDEQDRIAANTLAAQKAAKARAEAFYAKTEPYMQMLGGVADALTGISKLYGEGSNEARKFADAAEALIIAQKALAVVNAVAAVASSATAPWPVQWANMAAMLASMGSLLGSIGESINGGGSSSSSSTPAFWESNSTVLGGDAGEASKSVQNALDILNEVDAESYIELQGIHRQVKNLNDNITGLVRGILQSGATGGLGSLVNGAGVGSSGSSWMNSILGGGTAGLGVAGIGAYMFGTGLSGALAGASILGPIGAAAALLTPTLASLTEGIPIIGDIFGMLDGLLSGIGSFFGSSSTKVTGYGVGIDSAAIIDILNSAGDVIDAYYWVATRTKKKSFGHVTRSSSTSTQGMTDIEENPWEMLFYSLSSSLVEVAGSIGRDSAEEMQRVFEYVFEVPKLDLANKTASEIQEAVQSWFNAIADTAAGDLFGDFLLQFQDMGEGLFETAVRIVADKEIILDALDQMGLAFEGTAEDAIYFAEGLIKLAGDLDTLQGYMTTYIDAFLTDQEKLINTGERLNAILDTYNMTLPATREGYADLVEGLDLTTESGQDAYYALMRLSQAADQYYDYMERRMEDLLSGAIDTEKSSITDQYNEQLEILNKRFEAAKDIVSDLTNVVNALKKAKEAMRLEDQAYLKGMYEWSMAKLGQYAEQAQRGRLPSVDQINKISEYLTTPNNAKYYSSAIDYQRDYWKVYNQFSSIEAEAQKQLSAAERTVQLIQEQIDILKDWYEDELAKLDTLYDALMGIDNSVLTLAQAISQLAAIQASTGNITPGVSDYITNGGTGDPILNLYSMLLNRNPLAPNAEGVTDVAGYNYWKSAYTSGYSLDQIMDWMMESPEYQAIKAARGFAYGGISSGPETGYQATLHGTELIVSPKGGYPARVKDGGNVIEMTEMKKDIKALREDGKKTRKYLDEMRRDMREWNTSGLLTRTS